MIATIPFVWSPIDTDEEYGNTTIPGIVDTVDCICLLIILPSSNLSHTPRGPNKKWNKWMSKYYYGKGCKQPICVGKTLVPSTLASQFNVSRYL